LQLPDGSRYRDSPTRSATRLLLERKVVDKTGLTGKYDFTLN